MTTPILTKQQQKHSLSAKKTPVKGLRNVLAQPQDNFWPIVREAQKCSELEQLLKKSMPIIRRPGRTIPWSQLKQMTKEERSKVKLEALQKQEHVPDVEILNSVILGLNAITRSLEKNSVSCIVMDANIDPQLLVKHIVMMAQNKKIPILILPKLKTIILNAIGFPSAACALKDIVAKSPDHHFYKLYMKICNIFKDVPLPKNSLQLFRNFEEPLDETIVEDGMISLEDKPEVDAFVPTKFKLSSDVYKYRSSRKDRVFVPPSAAISSNNKLIMEQTEENEFISLTNYDSDEYDTGIKKHMRYVNIRKNRDRIPKDYNVHKNVANVTYLPLKVKRLQGNSNRVKATKVSKKKKK